MRKNYLFISFIAIVLLFTACSDITSEGSNIRYDEGYEAGYNDGFEEAREEYQNITHADISEELKSEIINDWIAEQYDVYGGSFIVEAAKPIE